MKQKKQGKLLFTRPSFLKWLHSQETTHFPKLMISRNSTLSLCHPRLARPNTALDPIFCLHHVCAHYTAGGKTHPLRHKPYSWSPTSDNHDEFCWSNDSQILPNDYFIPFALSSNPQCLLTHLTLSFQFHLNTSTIITDFPHALTITSVLWSTFVPVSVGIG